MPSSWASPSLSHKEWYSFSDPLFLISSLEKFDGRYNRNLAPNELGQIAGRAGRHLNDGTFGITGNSGEISAEETEAIENHKFPIKNSNLKINIESEISLYGRKNALQRCFSNIINNGLVYGEKINVNVEKSSNRVVILFEDNGPGIPVEHYKNVFKPFFRLDKSRSLNKSGVGLGLAIVEDIVNSHGGKIQLSKSNMGGLQVKISLPL